MAKRIYQLGEPCDYCQTPTVEGKFGAYCKKCYIEYKNRKESLQAPVNGYHPKTTQSPTPAPIVQPSVPQELTEALQKIAKHLNDIDIELERQKWFLDEIYKKLEPGWKALSQDGN